MRIVYIASGIPVPGMLGGSTHALEVARGLAQRGHEIHLLAAGYEGWGGLSALARPVSTMLNGFHLHHQNIPKALTWMGAWGIWRLIRAVRPDAIIERYYNFAGVGVWAAHRLGIPCVLEVNALIVDPPEVLKRRLDDALGGPMRRWAVMQCRWADCIVTPLHTTVPPDISRSKIVEMPWGAAVGRFEEEDDSTPWPLERGNGRGRLPTAVFLGSFRNWHGVVDFVRAGALLLASGRDYRFVLIGDGPERPDAERLASAWPGRFHFTGAIPYAQVPGELRQATVGVAPFTTAPHPALRTAGFFWSPLKVYEYMAASLPVVTTDLYPLNEIIHEGREGALFREGDLNDLAAAMDRVLSDPERASIMGAGACARVVAYYSWQQHCEKLEALLERLKRKAGRGEAERESAV